MFDLFGKRRPVKKDHGSSINKPTPAHVQPENVSYFRFSTRNFEDFQENDVAIKLWLPEPADNRLNELSDYRGVSRSEFLRLAFFEYVYGRYELEAMRAQSVGLFWRPNRPNLMAAARRRSGPNTTPELGKNAEDVKLWLPTRMKADLQNIAERAGKPLSQFMREVLVSVLFGHLPLATALQPEPEK